MRKILKHVVLAALVWTVFILCPKDAYAIDLAVPGMIPEQDIMAMPAVPVQTVEPVARNPGSYNSLCYR